jgi:hypothetical protein
MKIYARSRFDVVSAVQSTNALGTFNYNSLAELESNRPASFTRVFAAPTRSAGSWLGAASVGDLWQVSPTFVLQPGLRFEANRFLTTPTENPGVTSAFGISNAGVPNTVHVSPRLGFAWTFSNSRFNPPFGSGAVGRIPLPPRGILSGGFGEFRNDITAASALGPLSATGLPGDARQLTCVGAAVPTPDWSLYARDPSAIPTLCANAAAPAFSDAAPDVLMFDRDYSLPHSWRGNVRWGSGYKRLHYSVDAAYSFNRNQPGSVDLNFAGVPRFSLSDESARPVLSRQAASFHRRAFSRRPKPAGARPLVGSPTSCRTCIRPRARSSSRRRPYSIAR